MWHQMMSVFWSISKEPLAQKLYLWLYYLLRVDKEYFVRKPNKQAIRKQKIVTLHDQVFIKQSILEVGLRFFGTTCIYTHI